MKKIKIFLILLSVLFFSSCQISQYIVQGLLSNVKDKTKGECYDKSVEILRCFDEKDVEGLKSFFCQHSQDNPNIYKEIEDAFDFYKGKSTSFKFAYNGGVAGSWRDGKAEDEHITPEIREIITDADNTYLIFYHEFLTYKKDEKCVGITYMLIFDENTDEKIQIGKYID